MTETAEDIDAKLPQTQREAYRVVDDITRRLDSGVYAETKCDCPLSKDAWCCMRHLRLELADLALRYHEWARGLDYSPNCTITEDQIKRTWMHEGVFTWPKERFRVLLSFLLYKSLGKPHEDNNLLTGMGGVAPKVDDVFGFLRMRLYAYQTMSFGDAYRETGSFPFWFPTGYDGVAAMFREHNVLSIAANGHVLDALPITALTYHNALAQNDRLAPRFISAGLWCVVRVWLAAYQVSKGSAHADMLIRPTNSLVCAQWARAPPNLAIPESDRKHASPLDLIMGFAGLHYNYLQAVAGAVILPRPEAIKVGGHTLKQGLVSCKVMKRIEARVDAERGIPLAYQFDSSDSDMQDEDVPRKRGAKRGASSMSE
jgi:hypothetical protein